MRRRGTQFTLSTEHRAAPSRDHIPLQLTQKDSALALSIWHDSIGESSSTGPSITERVRQALAALKEPITLQALRKLCTMRTGFVCAALAQLIELGLVIRTDSGYQLKRP